MDVRFGSLASKARLFPSTGHPFNRIGRLHEQKLPTYFAGNGTCSSKFDPSIAPAGKHVAFWWPWAPYDLDGDPQNWDKRKDEVADRMLSQWREFAPNLTEKNVVAKVVLSPLDIERHCINMVKGSHHDESRILSTANWLADPEFICCHNFPLPFTPQISVAIQALDQPSILEFEGKPGVAQTVAC